MRGLAFAPATNSPGRSDTTSVFIPEARRFAAIHGLPAPILVPVGSGVPVPQRTAFVLAALARAPHPLNVVAFFCHGTRRSIQFADIASAPQLARAIVGTGFPLFRSLSVTVPLYACSTAGGEGIAIPEGGGPGGEGGFADVLAEALVHAGAWTVTVDAHTTVGHATQNPNVRRWSGKRILQPTGGRWLVEPRSALWRAWDAALDDNTRLLRLRFPLMSDAAIQTALRGGGIVQYGSMHYLTPQLILGGATLAVGAGVATAFGAFSANEGSKSKRRRPRQLSLRGLKEGP